MAAEILPFLESVKLNDNAGRLQRTAGNRS